MLIEPINNSEIFNNIHALIDNRVIIEYDVGVYDDIYTVIGTLSYSPIAEVFVVTDENTQEIHVIDYRYVHSCLLLES